MTISRVVNGPPNEKITSHLPSYLTPFIGNAGKKHTLGQLVMETKHRI